MDDLIATAREATLRANLAQERAKVIREINFLFSDLETLYEGYERQLAEIRNIIDVWASWAHGRASKLDQIVEQNRREAARALELHENETN